jgi:hypothetical protein
VSVNALTPVVVQHIRDTLVPGSPMDECVSRTSPVLVGQSDYTHGALYAITNFSCIPYHEMVVKGGLTRAYTHTTAVLGPKPNETLTQTGLYTYMIMILCGPGIASLRMLQLECESILSKALCIRAEGSKPDSCVL